MTRPFRIIARRDAQSHARPRPRVHPRPVSGLAGRSVAPATLPFPVSPVGIEGLHLLTVAGAVPELHRLPEHLKRRAV